MTQCEEDRIECSKLQIGDKVFDVIDRNEPAGADCQKVTPRTNRAEGLRIRDAAITRDFSSRITAKPYFEC